MSSINIRVTGDTQELLNNIENLQRLDTEAAMAAIGEALRTSTMERFTAGKGPDGSKWKTSIRAANTGRKTLIDSSRLMNSIRTEYDRTGMAVGTNTIYAATHQLGDNRTIKPKNKKVLRWKFNGQWVSAKQVKVKIPARPFLGISEEDNEEIMATLDDMMRGE